MASESALTEASQAGLFAGIKTPRDRVPQERGATELPDGLVVVSADNHWSVTGDLFYERFPSHLRERAPRLWQDEEGHYHWDVDGKNMIPEVVKQVLHSFEAIPGCVELKPRLKDLDREGIQKEIVFGNAVNGFFSFPDLEVREWIYRIYNQHLAEMADLAPGRFFGVGVPNFWDPAKAKDSINEIKDLGLKTFLLPQVPRGANFVELNYADASMEPLWQAAEDSGLPVCFHVGEFFKDGPGGVGTSAMVNFGPFRKNLGELIFGGIFDRHPSLRVVFAEADLNWIPGALQTAEFVYETNKAFLNPKVQHRPHYYWKNNCYATFIYDPVGLGMIDKIGADRVMWSHDYPHTESALGISWSSMQTVIDAVSEDDARRILGGTAIELFDLG